MNFYSFHVGDYIKQTVHLSATEDICYRRLLDMYYDTEQPIPLETHWVSRRLRLDSEVVESVLNEFFIRTESGWKNPRCDEEIAAYQRKSAANRSNGKQGGRPKKTQSVILANPSESEPNLNQEPRTKNQYINPSSSDKPDDGFAEFWKAYPRKTGKGAALKAWGKLKDKRNKLALILAALSWQTKTHDWTKDGGQFIPHPTTWLNGHRWLDEPVKGIADTPQPISREEAEQRIRDQRAAARQAHLSREAA